MGTKINDNNDNHEGESHCGSRGVRRIITR